MAHLQQGDANGHSAQFISRVMAHHATTSMDEDQ